MHACFFAAVFRGFLVTFFLVLMWMRYAFLPMLLFSKQISCLGAMLFPLLAVGLVIRLCTND